MMMTRRANTLIKVVLALSLLAVVGAALAAEPPGAREAAQEALLGLSFLSHNGGRVADVLGSQTPATEAAEFELHKGLPLPVFQIEMVDLRFSRLWSDFKAMMKLLDAHKDGEEFPASDFFSQEEMQEAEQEIGEMTPADRKLFEEADSLSELLAKISDEEPPAGCSVPPKPDEPQRCHDAAKLSQDRREWAGMFAFLDAWAGGNRERVLGCLEEDKPKQLVFQALKDADPGQVTPVVVRTYPKPDFKLPPHCPYNEGSEDWRLFKVGQAPLAEALRSNPDALYILQVPALYLSFLARPPDAEGLAEDCKPVIDEETSDDPKDQVPSPSDCLVAMYDFPDDYRFGIKKGVAGSFSSWLFTLEFLAKTWQGSPERTMQWWEDRKRDRNQPDQ